MRRDAVSLYSHFPLLSGLDYREDPGNQFQALLLRSKLEVEENK